MEVENDFSDLEGKVLELVGDEERAEGIARRGTKVFSMFSSLLETSISLRVVLGSGTFKLFLAYWNLPALRARAQIASLFCAD